jgi:hypothetical protein
MNRFVKAKVWLFAVAFGAVVSAVSMVSLLRSCARLCSADVFVSIRQRNAAIWSTHEAR